MKYNKCQNMMNKFLHIWIISTLLVILTTNVSDANSSPSLRADDIISLQPTNLKNIPVLRRKSVKETLEQNQQKYQKIKDDIKEIKEIIDDLPISDPIVDTELNNKINHGRKELLKKTRPRKLVTVDEKATPDMAPDLSPYGKKWRDIVHIEDEYNAHASSGVIHLIKLEPFAKNRIIQ